MDFLRTLDQEGLRTINQAWHSDWLTPVFWVITTTGLGHVQTPLTFLLWKSERWRPLIWMALVNLVLGGLASGAVKRLVPRPRPSQVHDTLVAVDEVIIRKSFVSGHTTTSFALATCIFLIARRNEKPWIGILAYLWATLVGLSRIYRGVHWPTDALGGAFLGVACGIATYAFVDWLTIRRRSRLVETASNLEAAPVA